MKDIKDFELKQMENIYNWKEITKGLFRFGIGISSCYEIHINICKQNTPILMANASLFLAGNFYDKDGNIFFLRDCLLENRNVQNCIEKAIEYYNKNMNWSGKLELQK